MYKKILITLSAVCTAVTMTFGGAAITAENASVMAAEKKVNAVTAVQTAIKTVKTGKDNVKLFNDMTADEFLKAVAEILPEGSAVKLSFDKETDYRIWNASSEKDGSIFANILFTCDTYTQHEMYDFKMPMLTGDAAEANANREKLDEDVAAVNSRMKFLAVNNDSTQEEMLEMAREVVKNGSTVEWENDFEKVNSTRLERGSIKGTLKLTLNGESGTVKVSKLIAQDIPENQNIPRSTPKPKTDAPSAEPVPKPSETPVPSADGMKFADVTADAYYADAVKWAVQNEITSGTSDTTFSPDDTCTRAQILTFMWRAAGKPKAEIENPFTDVNEGDYYYDAAVWAAECGMVDGDIFAADTPCTRSSTVTYMWKSNGKPEIGEISNFNDVDASAEYAKAVAWAVEEEVTGGTSDTTFSPDDICSRGQIVTFLYRAF